MPYTVVAFEPRKPSLTPAQFKDYYETTHVPLIKSSTGPYFPRKHIRYYLKRASDAPAVSGGIDTSTSSSKAEPETTTASGSDHTPLAFVGSPASFDYDAIVLLEFDDEQHFLGFQQRYMHPDIQAIQVPSEENFLERSKLRVIGVSGPEVTSKDD